MKKVKKINRTSALILVLMMTLMLLLQSEAVANEVSGIDDAVIKVKSLIDIPNELTEFESEKHSDGNGVEYSFVWHVPHTEDEDKYPENSCGEISVQVNGNGDIVWYRKDFLNRNTRKSLAEFSDDEYKRRAMEWLNKINPDIASQYEFLDIYSSVNSSDVRLTFERKKDGFNYCNNSISVRLDKQSGEVIFYRLNHLYTNDGADLTKLVDENTKRDGFLKQNKLEKFYIKRDGLKEAVLVYAPTNPNVVLDLETAEIPKLTEEEENRIKNDKVFYEENLKENFYSSSGLAGGGSSSAQTAEDEAAVELSEQEVKAIEDYSRLISPENAEKIIREIENTVIDECTLNSYEYYKTSKRDVPVPLDNETNAEFSQQDVAEDMYYAVFRFSNESNLKDTDYLYTEANVAINAETGELVELYSYSYSDRNSDNIKLDKSVRESNARAFVKKYSPNEADKVNNFDTDDENSTNFRFNESVNGIKYRDNYITVGVDEYNGKIMNFSKNWLNGVAFEKEENILSESDVANILFTQIGFEEYYTNIAYVEYAPAIRLVYELKSAHPYYISATTGKLLDYDGREKSDAELKNADGFDDISGHYAENIINILLKNNVIELGEDNKFRPDEVLIYKDAQAILSSLNYYTDEYVKNYKRQTGIKPSDNTVLTRMGAVECIINSIGYGKAARLDGIYNCGFKDAEALGEKVGYAAIAKALGIVKGDENGCFNPNDNVTRADFAIMIYNMLVSGIEE